MLKCTALVDVLNGNYKGSYKEFEKVLCDAVKEEMIKINDDINNACECLVEEKLINKSGEVLGGRAIGISKIQLNKSVIMELFKGNKMYLITVFHELAHIRQNVLIESGADYSNVIRYIKDMLLNYYQELENDRLLGKNSHYISSDVNYSKEIDVEVEAVYSMIEFCGENNIDISDIMNTLYDYIDNLKARKNKERYVGDCISFNSHYLTLEEAFDIAISDHAEWLFWYPQLLNEYSVINGGIVVKKRKITDLYYQPKRMVREKINR